MDNKVIAYMNGDRIECGACHALLAKRLSPHGIRDFAGESATEFMRQQEPRYIKKIESHANTLEIKCKSRKDSVTCNYINIINL